ncbi:MAG: Phosphoglycerol transferase I [Flavobacteriales bacterium]|nr:Phosphoglycerol transferase I [Flavobacteriales bacterium]
MMNIIKNIFFHKRFSLLYFFALFYLTLSFLTRIALYIWAFESIDFSIIGLFRIILTGLFFDLGVISYFSLPYLLYLLILPKRFSGSLFDKSITYFAYFVGLTIFTFSFLAEFTFWDEFKSRFNFIAVDYLIYTFEVVQNIHQSYPLYILLPSVVLVVILFMLLTAKKDIFKNTFGSTITFTQKLPITILTIFVSSIYTVFIPNNLSDWSLNRFDNELSKSGIYSFFAAFRNNELSYPEFYVSQDLDDSFAELKKMILAENETFVSPKPYSLKREVKNTGEEYKPNVIFICIESFSADFMRRFGNQDNITPYLDSLAPKSIFFTNLFATGTRTVRGMEAISLSVPPSPGSSIVKRKKNNSDLFTIGTVFKQKNYKNVFFYGGDGYFDNMNQYFGGNGFEIVDRGRGYIMGDNFKSKRTNINDNEVQFENAWGICDEDIYNKVLKEADKDFANNQLFFNFVMTTSNHKPYTYPEGRIDIPSKSGRSGAVKYTDYAIYDFLEKAKKKPWFKNTVFVIMSDHCASSAGKQELDVAKYHIPAFIYNLPQQEPKELNQLCSQIDLFPTLFGYLNWSYTTQLFGRDVNKMKPEDERTFIGNYRKMGYLKEDKLMVLGDMKSINYYSWDKKSNILNLLPNNEQMQKEAISYYQCHDYLFQNNLLIPE